MDAIRWAADSASGGVLSPMGGGDVGLMPGALEEINEAGAFCRTS